MSSKQSAHNKYQREYFDTVDRARLARGEKPYVLSHVDRVVPAAALMSGQRILEVGVGPRKFTLLLVNRGIDVVANDLPATLLERFMSRPKYGHR